MLGQFFPKTNSKERDKKKRVVKKLKKLGERLYILKEKFGKGVLGLIPDDGLTIDGTLSITDAMSVFPLLTNLHKFDEA